jgi:hypothetical protein
MTNTIILKPLEHLEALGIALMALAIPALMFGALLG